MKFRVAIASISLALSSSIQAAVPDEKTLADVDAIFSDWQRAAHVPGLVYGIVADGRLVAWSPCTEWAFRTSPPTHR